MLIEKRLERPKFEASSGLVKATLSSATLEHQTLKKRAYFINLDTILHLRIYFVQTASAFSSTSYVIQLSESRAVHPGRLQRSRPVHPHSR